MDIHKKLEELKKEHNEKNPNGWDDYEWMTGRGNFVEGQMSILEELVEENAKDKQ